MVQNKDIATRLGIHVVHLARLRSGDRKPSLRLMYKIERELGWTIGEQTTAYDEHDRKSYAAALRQFLQAKFGIPDRGENGPVDEDDEVKV